MKVRVVYFAAVRDLVGRDEERLELPDACRTVAAFASFLEELRPELKGRWDYVRVARNEVFARPQDEVADGDTLALIPPVAGG